MDLIKLEKQVKYMAYIIDIDPKQDHFKITKYKYQRKNINAK